MGSSRLHKKMVRNIGNYSLITYFIKSLKTVPLIDNIILATTVNKEDVDLCLIAKQMKVDFYRGSQNNVLDRIDNAISTIAPNTSVVVRACADNPLIDSKILNQIIEETMNKNHLVTPFELNSCPFGIGLAVFPRFEIKKIKKKTKNPVYLEHVENYLIEKENFSFFHKYNNYISHYFYLTVDFEEDLHRCNYFLKSFNLSNRNVYKNVKISVKEEVCFITFEKKWLYFEKYLNQLKIKLFIFKNNESLNTNIPHFDLSRTLFTDNNIIFKKIKNQNKKVYFCDLKNLYLKKKWVNNTTIYLQEEIKDEKEKIFYEYNHNLKNLAQFIFILRFLRFGFIRKNLFADYWSSSSKTESGKNYGFENFEQVCCPQRIIFEAPNVSSEKFSNLNKLISIIMKVLNQIYKKNIIKHKICFKGNSVTCLQLENIKILNHNKINHFRDLIINKNSIENLLYILEIMKENKNSWIMIWICFKWQGKELNNYRLKNSKLFV